MTSARTDVTGIGNAIVDIIGRCDDALLLEMGAAKGAMTLVSADDAARIYSRMGPSTEVSGGSAANTIAGVASFGGRAGFIGVVADDEFGRIFSHDIRSLGVAFNGTPVAGDLPTSRSLILVTPDGQRTMNTYLGISSSLDSSIIDEPLIRDSAILYLEGYLFDREDAKRAFRDAVTIARSAGRDVALTLSDAFCVDRHRDEFISLIKSGIGILFANESEIQSLYQTSSFETAAQKVRNDTKLAVLTRSEKGSMIISDGRSIDIAAEPVAEIVDTTGAGDLYAAGFLYGYARELPLETCGKLASLAAAEVISHMGARPAVSLAQLARKGLLIT